MFSLFHEKSSEENPTENTAAKPTRALHPLIRSHGAVTGLALALAVVLGYGIHERSVAASSSARSAAAAMELKDTRAQVSALSAKLDALAKSQQAERPPADAVPGDEPPVTVRSMKPAPGVATAKPAPSVAWIKPAPSAVMHPTGQRQKPDPRWKKVQAQLDAQGKEIDAHSKQLDAQGKQIESTRQDIASTRTDLEGSIARTHDELVVLQKKGERNYVEFDLDKSKNFHSTGPVGISLRKADRKHQFADLKLLVDDRELTKKHLNLYEPMIFYPSEERQAVELVINSITKDHVHGYISSPRYKNSELAGGGATTTTAGDRHKLEGPR